MEQHCQSSTWNNIVNQLHEITVSQVHGITLSVNYTEQHCQSSTWNNIVSQVHGITLSVNYME